MSQEIYEKIIVESFVPNSTAGRHGEIHIRPIKGQEGFNQDLFVQCSKELVEDYPLGTKFKIKVKSKLSRREGGKEFIYSYYKWPYIVLK